MTYGPNISSKFESSNVSRDNVSISGDWVYMR